jgi:16S rRNA (uracil1498-N3)-methyltransferase
VTLRRIHLPAERIDGARGLLGPEARRYLADVLRLSPGASIEVFDGRGGRYGAEIGPGFEWVALGPREVAPPASVEIALVVALAKGEKMDLVVQKATELGVGRVLPFEAERSVVRLEPAKGEERAGRWRRIAEEAARQCGRADVPEVSPPAALARALSALAPGTRTFVFHPGGGRLDAGGAASVAAVVGPEGGLTDAEVAACEAAGAVRAGLGPRVLRAETAAIVAVALLQARFGDLA